MVISVLREAIKVEKKSLIIIKLFRVGSGVGSEVIITLFILCLEWPNSSRNSTLVASLTDLPLPGEEEEEDGEVSHQSQHANRAQH